MTLAGVSYLTGDDHKTNSLSVDCRMDVGIDSIGKIFEQEDFGQNGRESKKFSILQIFRVVKEGR